MVSNKASQELHDKAVMQIAELMFTFPNGEFTPGVFHPSWITHTNVPEQKMPVLHRWMGELYPDIVIVDTERANVPMVIAEVETKETLSLEQAIQPKWKPDMDECSMLYLFVPEGCARDAALMLLDFKVCFPTALYTYGTSDGQTIHVTPV